MRKFIISLTAMALFTAALSIPASAQDKDKEKNKAEPVINLTAKEVQGEVSYITKRSISLVTSRNKESGEETEILLPYGKNLVIEHKKNLSEIQSGDVIKVKYTEESIDYGDRQEIKIEAKVVTFMNPAAQDSPYKKARETLQQQAAQQGETLPLKGVKSDE
jgi:hypothetical protein